jgi:hypothetical protein
VARCPLPGARSARSNPPRPKSHTVSVLDEGNNAHELDKRDAHLSRYEGYANIALCVRTGLRALPTQPHAAAELVP